MAVSANTVWSIISTGANTNGGGFVTGASGTDQSQNNGPLFALTGATSSGAGNVVLHASAAATMVGNIAQCISGTNFTAGFFEVISVVAGVSITFGTNSAGVAITTGVGATGVINVGGAYNLNNATVDPLFFKSVQAGNTCWIKNGAYTLGAGISALANGTVGNNIAYIGYNSSRGDACNGANRPVLTLGANALNLSSTYASVSNLSFTGTAGTMVSVGGFGKATNCLFVNTSTTAARGAANFTTGLAINCEFVSYRGNAITFSTSTGNVLNGCYIHDSNIGINVSTSQGVTLEKCIIADNVTQGVLVNNATAGYFQANNCTLYGAENKLGVGVSVSTGVTVPVRLTNSIVYGFTTGVSQTDANAAMPYDDYNDYLNNTTDNTNWTKGANDVAVNPNFASIAQLTGSAGVVSGSTLVVASATGIVANQDFVYIVSGTGATAGKYLITNVSGTTLTLSSAPGGSGSNIVYQITTGHNFSPNTNFRTNGFPGVFPGGLTTGYLSLGAVQPAITTASVFAG